MNDDSTLLIVKEVTNQEAHDTFAGRGVQDRVSYYQGICTRWFLLGDPPIGHASMTKVGIGDKDSCHFRFGKWWTAPEHRGHALSAMHAGALIYHYVKHVISASQKIVTLRAWNELVDKYQSNGWVDTKKQFKGPFTELRKVFYFSWHGDLIEQRGFAGIPCAGIIYPGDFQHPIQFIPLLPTEITQGYLSV